MVRRLAAVALLFVAWVITGCYDVPKPVCGFVCGPSLACPDDYTCQVGRCVLDSAIATSPACPGPDASIPIDGADALVDAPAPPMVVAHVPMEFAANVPVGTTVTVTFSEDVMGIDVDSFRVVELDQGIPIAATITLPDARTAVLTPAQPLRRGVTHDVTLSSLITDLEGNPLPFTQWNFRTEPDLVPPTIASRAPAPDATGVAIDGMITVRFNEDMSGVNDSTFTLSDGANFVFGSVSYDPATFIAEFQLSEHLRPNTTYTARLSGAMTDIGGNPLVGAPVTWSFRTGADTVPPSILFQFTFPEADATGVGLSENVSIRFDEEVIGVGGATLMLKKGADVVPTTVTYFAGTRSATIDPTSSLIPNSTYTITVSGITDLVGNPIVPVSWSFTTAADTAAPFVSFRSPTFGATNVVVSATVTVTFSEPVVNVSSATFTLSPGGGTVSYNETNRTATLVPNSILGTNTTYTVALSVGITDLAGNALTSAGAWNFTTVADATPPSAMLTTPANGATGVALTSPIVVTFDEPVFNVGGATFRVLGVDGNFSSAMGGREWTYTPVAQLPANTTVNVALTTGITDAFGNALTPVTFTFSTAP